MLNINKVSVKLLLIRLIKISLSFIIVILSAYYFGVSSEFDVWIIVFTLLNTINLTLWGPLNEIFRSKFIYLKEERGEIFVLNAVKALINVTFVVSTITFILIAIFSFFTINIISPTISEHKFLFLTLTLLLSPSLLLNQIISIYTSVLNTRDIFFLPELLGIISAIINLIIIIAFAPLIGIYSLLISQILSSIILFTTIILKSKIQGINLLERPSFNDFRSSKDFFKDSLPFYLPYFITQFNNLLEKFLSNKLGVGIVSIINYSSQFKNIIQAVFSSVFITLLVPTLSKTFIVKDYTSYNKDFNNFLKVTFYLLSLIIPILYVNSNEISDILFNHGNINKDYLLSISILLKLYSIATIGVLLYLIFGLTLLSQNQGSKYAFYGVVSQIITLIINVLLLNYLNLKVFAYSLIISHFSVSVPMFYNLQHINKREVFVIVSKFFILITTQIIILTYLLNFLANILNNNYLVIASCLIISFMNLLILSNILRLDLISFYKSFTNNN